ncbi:hypothetical protein E2R40_08520 [Rathayibacter toxicus]|uniref:hypothetical protein n=1 Tax=Rathayibacter toxicus TaxID=145458 RepID=UPI0003FD4E68|nr:hypothetical protein [Rathayibacter toxicus]ALS56897.1 hypothetical protein APU90_03220 [Rathayibacter toxicus]PPH88698.1 hypothetical protein C5D31_03040 [Rathayibacter toxicus]QWL30760.1 hypothetical protein E2R34_08465 [Rathayibacter toxicus]QWL39174.1 hypothetical protein E2R38_08520 [Rathayibacter toxicus]QWL43366.1 hypothetical protein E2R40_08520 [Rathayibacter toxicus]
MGELPHAAEQWPQSAKVRINLTRVGAVDYDAFMLALELFYLGLLGLASIAIAWVSGVVVYKLYRGQS